MSKHESLLSQEIIYKVLHNKYTRCRHCDALLSEGAQRSNLRNYRRGSCEKDECRHKEWLITTPVCCDKAQPMYCVCAYATTCPEHGERHNGTHD